MCFQVCWGPAPGSGRTKDPEALWGDLRQLTRALQPLPLEGPDRGTGHSGSEFPHLFEGVLPGPQA